MSHLSVGVAPAGAEQEGSSGLRAADAPVSGGVVDVAGVGFVPTIAYPKPGEIDLVDPEAEADWQRRASKQRARVRRVRTIEKGIESACAGISGSKGQAVLLWFGLLVGLGLLGFGMLARF